MRLLVVGRRGEWRLKPRQWMAAGVLISLFLIGGASGAAAQKGRRPRRPRRETNSSRQARIARTIQETYSHPWEAFGGGGYLRWKSGEFTKKNNEVSWNAAANYYLNPKLAIVGDARGSFGSANQQLPLQFPQIPHPQINEYFFTGGASYRFYAKEKVALSAGATGGVAWGIFSKGAKGLTGTEVGLWPDGFRPAFTVNIGADYNIYPNFAVRVSPSYVGTTFGGGIQNNLGINAGIIYRFGKQR